ncbi:MAG: SPFH domain-containing protein [Anaerolineae bacterium]|jgi:hypothetical protein
MNHLENVESILAKLDLTDCVGLELNEKANDARLKQDWEKAFESAQRSLDLCQRKSSMRYIRSAGIAKIYLGAIHHSQGTDQGRKEAARHYANSVAHLANDRRNRSVALLAQALVRRELGEWGAAIEALQFSLDILKGFDQGLYDEVEEELRKTLRMMDKKQEEGAKEQKTDESAATAASSGGTKSQADFDHEREEPATRPKRREHPGTGEQIDIKQMVSFAVAFTLVFVLLSLILALIGLLRSETNLLIAAATIFLVVVLVPLLALVTVPPWLQRAGFLYSVREGEVAVIEMAGRSEEKDVPGLCFCIPLIYRIRAIVPTWEQSTAYIAQVADRHQKQLKVNLSVRYDVVDPSEAAYSALQKEEHPRKTPLLGPELAGIWEKQVHTDLSLALAHVFAEHPADAAWERREQLQDQIEKKLAQRTDTWGLSVNEVCLHQIEEP